MMGGEYYYLFLIFIIYKVAHARNIRIFHHVKFSITARLSSYFDKGWWAGYIVGRIPDICNTNAVLLTYYYIIPRN